MIRALSDWLDDRTGYRRLMSELLYERIPGGPRWRYVWGSTLVFTFAIQVITGFCLWMAYSPGIQNAWASVHFMEHSIFLGGIVRGLHHYTAQAMVVLLAIHFLQVVIDGAYRAPREVNYWLGLILAQIVLVLALTGYLLPWDQKGYYATQVATKIVGATPVVGPSVQNLLQGGDDYGQQTLTRFFALHAGFLPALLVIVLSAHLLLFRRHGITARDPNRREAGWFWPEQILLDSLACLFVLAVVLGLAFWKGAELSAPANPAEPYSAARPEWYFLALFRFLKFEWVEHLGLAFGAIYVPAGVGSYFLALPLIAKLPGGHGVNVAVTILILLALIGLTGLAWYEDRDNPDHQAALAEAKRDAARARQLASLPTRVPIEGPVRLLQEDPYTRGPRIFAAHCSGCHHFLGHDGRGRTLMEWDPDAQTSRPAKPTAPDLGNLGSREWLRAVLVDFTRHFAALKNAEWYGDDDTIDVDESEMADWSGDHASLLSEENRENLKAVIEFLVAESGRRDMSPDRRLAEMGRIVATEAKWSGSLEEISCRDCHETIGEKFDPTYVGESGYPNLAEYLSYKWLVDFIADPGSPRHYGAKNRMPAFRDRLSSEELDLLARWLTRDYHPEPESNSPTNETDEHIP